MGIKLFATKNVESNMKVMHLLLVLVNVDNDRSHSSLNTLLSLKTLMKFLMDRQGSDY